MTLISAEGKPVPPSEIAARVRQIHPRLSLRFADITYHGDGQKYWAVALEWAEDDKRRAMIQSGDMSPGDAYDVMGYLPIDCPLDQAYGYLVNNFHSRRGSESAKMLLDWVHKYNDSQTASVMEPMQAEAEEMIEKEAKSLMKKTGGSQDKVFVTDRRKRR